MPGMGGVKDVIKSAQQVGIFRGDMVFKYTELFGCQRIFGDAIFMV